MTEDERATFRTRLVELAEELAANLALTDSSADSIKPDNAIGRLTRMEAIQAQSMTAEGWRRQEARLRLVAQALERIDQGTYGACVRCGEQVPPGRLEVMPEAPLCIACAARRR